MAGSPVRWRVVSGPHAGKAGNQQGKSNQFDLILQTDGWPPHYIAVRRHDVVLDCKPGDQVLVHGEAATVVSSGPDHVEVALAKDGRRQVVSAVNVLPNPRR